MAMDILEEYFPDEDHVMVFDNATTHLKRADTALSARKMPKFPPKHGKEWDGSNCTVLKLIGFRVQGGLRVRLFLHLTKYNVIRVRVCNN